LREGRFGIAIERYRAGLERVEALLLSVPDWPRARTIARNLNVALAGTLGNEGRHREAINAWDRALGLDNGEFRLPIIMNRAFCLAKAGDAPQALAEAEAIAKEPIPFEGGDRYDLACVASIAAGSFEKAGSSGLAEPSARRAMQWLNQALDLGLFRDPVLLDKLKQSDDDLKYLRPRPDFQLLLLDATFPTDPFRSGR
jgi:tetratricopeptide (TPR) repeat protein